MSACDVEKIVNNMQSRKAPGIDQIRAQDIKYVGSEMCSVLALFINLCIKRGAYPDTLKKSLIRPIYKQGSHMDYTNYRPIAILSVVDKIVEKIIVGQISKFLERYNIISNSQHGFRKNRSTSTALTRAY